MLVRRVYRDQVDLPDLSFMVDLDGNEPGDVTVDLNYPCVEVVGGAGVMDGVPLSRTPVFSAKMREGRCAEDGFHRLENGFPCADRECEDGFDVCFAKWSDVVVHLVDLGPDGPTAQL
jgi:hypothetical protein